MKLNRSMNTNVLDVARSIEVRATVKSDTTILKAYKAFQRICDVEKKYSMSVIDYPNTLVIANNALIEIAEAIEGVGRYGTKYFEDEFIQNSADILDRSCPDITGQINAMYNNIATLQQLNTIYASAQAVKDRIMMYTASDSDEKSNAKSSVKDEKTDSASILKNDATALDLKALDLKKRRARRSQTDINE